MIVGDLVIDPKSYPQQPSRSRCLARPWLVAQRRRSHRCPPRCRIKGFVPEGEQFVKQREARFCSSRASLDLTADACRRQGWVKAGGAARRGSLDAVAARGRMLTEVEVGLFSRSSLPRVRQMGHQVRSPGPKRASGGKGADALACHSCAVCRHGVLRQPTRRGQSVSRPRRQAGARPLGDHAPSWCPMGVTPPARWPWNGWCRPEGRRRRG